MRAAQQHTDQEYNPIQERRTSMLVTVKPGDGYPRIGQPPAQAVRVTVTDGGFSVNGDGSLYTTPNAYCLLHPVEARRHAIALLQAAEQAEQASH